MSTNASPSRMPARSRRGLGLFDTILAIAVLSSLAGILVDVTRAHVERKKTSAEAQAVAQLALAGRQWLEADVAGRTPVSGDPTAVAFSTLEAAGLWSVTDPQITPYRRRDMELMVWNAGSGRSLVIARAEDSDGTICESPGGDALDVPRTLVDVEAGVSGVGVVAEIGGDLVLIGPGVFVDIDADFPAATVSCGDLVALPNVFSDVACTAYLHRSAVTGCAGANTMATDLDLGGNTLLNVGTLEAEDIEVETFIGSLEMDGDVTINGGLSIAGLAEIEELESSVLMEVAGPLDVACGLDVAGNLNVAGDLAAKNMTFDGTVTITGDARVLTLDANRLSAGIVTASEIFGYSGNFDQLVVTDLYVDMLAMP